MAFDPAFIITIISYIRSYASFSMLTINAITRYTYFTISNLQVCLTWFRVRNLELLGFGEASFGPNFLFCVPDSQLDVVGEHLE